MAGRRRGWRAGRAAQLFGRAVSGTARRRAATPGRAERYLRHPLHLRDHGPVQRRVLSACPIFLVGGLYRRPSRRRAKATYCMTTLPLFHTNALNSFFQALLNGATLIVEPAFPRPILADAERRRGDRHLCARRHGADVVGADRRATPSARTGRVSARACRAGAFSAAVHRALRHRPGRRLRLDRNQLRHGRAGRGATARHHGAASSPASPPASSTITTTKSPTVRRAN